MRIEWNRVTWYSKALAAALFVILPFAGFVIGTDYQRRIDAAKMSHIASDDTPDYVRDRGEMVRYLANEFGSLSYGGHLFASYDILGERRDGDRKDQYVWAQVEEYYLEGRELKTGMGISLPVRVSLELRGGTWVPVLSEAPRDGSFNGPDIKRIFPENVQDKIFLPTDHYNARSALLSQDNELAAQAHFSLLGP